jgi:hypothetical protein
MSEITEEVIDSPAFIELMGHRQIAGYLRSIRVAGSGMIRVDIPVVGAQEARTLYVNAGSVYALHLVDEPTMLGAVARLAGRDTPYAIASRPAPWPDEVVDAHVCEDDDCDHED